MTTPPSLAEVLTTQIAPRARSAPDAQTRHQIAHMWSLAWEASTSAERVGHLSGLSDLFTKAPASAGWILDTCRALTWSTMHGRTPWWMQMFVVANAPLAFDTPRGREAFGHWWSHRSAAIGETLDHWEPASSLNSDCVAQEAPSPTATPRAWRTWAMGQALPRALKPLPLAPPCSFAAGVSLFQALADQQEALGVPRRFNQWAGMLCEGLEPARAALAPDVQQWVLARRTVIHQARDLGLARSVSQMGAPEWLLKNIIVATMNQSKGTQDIGELVEEFWNACHARWQENKTTPGIQSSELFFLPSMNTLMIRAAQTFTQRSGHSAAQQFSAFAQKILLSAETGQWPWMDDEPATRPQRSRRM